MNQATPREALRDTEPYFLKPGRALRFSPRWDCSDAIVVFDSNSGDYWVLAELAALTVKALQNGGKASLSELAHVLDDPAIASDIHSALEHALQSLVDNGLVQPAQRPEPSVVRDPT